MPGSTRRAPSIRTPGATASTQGAAAPQHPKSALQEWAAAHNRRPPDYEVIDRSGPDHAPRFTVKASIGTLAEATAEGSSKQERKPRRRRRCWRS